MQFDRVISRLQLSAGGNDVREQMGRYAYVVSLWYYFFANTK